MCCRSSHAIWHRGHREDSTRLQRTRWTLRGEWPVRSCVRRLDFCLVSRLSVRLIWLGVDQGSIRENFWYLGVVFHSLSHFSRKFILTWAFLAEILAGSLWRKNLGIEVELCPFAARLASSSTASFSTSPWCPGAHAMHMRTLGHFFFIDSIPRIASSRRYCDGCWRFAASERIALWLSSAMSID